ncbi:EF-hand domain-containing protein [Marinoscillum pacificum]|uniref:EF-hand domain-containing protein n=1 Tax=Marinoscillum pacificum TaxID=392723 RepID=UPI0021585436|nr:EF-hand domain-containing protein [Marinoscillum pacificum]
MAKDIRKQKLTYLFQILDSDRNGILEPDDFVLVAERISDILQVGKEDPQRLQLKFKATRIYMDLLQDMGKTKVELDDQEWCAFFISDEESDSSAVKRYIFRTASYIFMLFDQDGDKQISKKEYQDMFTVYEIDQEHSEYAFEKLDTNHDDQISMAEMVHAFEDFFLSKEPQSAGNWIFGDWKSAKLV